MRRSTTKPLAVPFEPRHAPDLSARIDTLFRIAQKGMDFSAPDFLLERQFARQWTDEHLKSLNASVLRKTREFTETLASLNVEIAGHRQDISDARQQMSLLERALDTLMPATPPARLPEGPRRSAALSRVALAAAVGKVEQIGYSINHAQEHCSQRRAEVLADHNPVRAAWIAERIDAWRLIRSSLRNPQGREALSLMLTHKRPRKARRARQHEESSEVRHEREQQQKRLDELLQFELPCALFDAVMTLSMLGVEEEQDQSLQVDSAPAKAEPSRGAEPSYEPEEEWPSYSRLAAGF